MAIGKLKGGFRFRMIYVIRAKKENGMVQLRWWGGPGHGNCLWGLTHATTVQNKHTKPRVELALLRYGIVLLIMVLYCFLARQSRMNRNYVILNSSSQHP
ncbi:hypothetical protein VNO78_21073 [Psophocarpus tetragonolobus]|uniref:Uncharacterized protein n=1 Tax=Psophocarpus tetragonolobus TaxID=3891 RepID=A0AAN9SAI7_PSOTE